MIDSWKWHGTLRGLWRWNEEINDGGWIDEEHMSCVNRPITVLHPHPCSSHSLWRQKLSFSCAPWLKAGRAIYNSAFYQFNTPILKHNENYINMIIRIHSHMWLLISTGWKYYYLTNNRKYKLVTPQISSNKSEGGASDQKNVSNGRFNLTVMPICTSGTQ